MKNLIAICLFSLMGVAAQADVCATNSRGYSFPGSSAYEAVRSCQASSRTSNYECANNVVCRRDRGGRDDGRGGWDDGRGGRDDGRGGRDDGRGGRDDGRGGRDDGRGGRDDGRGGRDDGRGGPGPGRPMPPPSVNPGQCYLDRYPDICQNSPKNYCKDPAKHYREHGQGEGRMWGCN